MKGRRSGLKPMKKLGETMARLKIGQIWNNLRLIFENWRVILALLPTLADDVSAGYEERRFQMEVKSEKTRLGATPVCTVLNFTDIPLRMDGILKRYSLPARKEVPFEKRFQCRWSGQTFEASMLRIDAPLIYGKAVGATRIGAPDEAVVHRMAVSLTPAEIGGAILEKFNRKCLFPTVQLRRNDARVLSGVIAFIGESDSFQNHLSGGNLKIPVRNGPELGYCSVYEVSADRFMQTQMLAFGEPDDVGLTIVAADAKAKQDGNHAIL
jgi:hypothetical protein